ncbi:FAD/NAD(P)-binding domain containing protein [Trema orientale]|uniref:FAD/NAD(P)-binding domain containing protein n=1 Tax=Trema orientale TaxID=63057 RepID=A0A2P5EYZ1_TREOI|nr:FAD/NAD(P)-binding domain containing protein [Trema orientale]
MKVSNDMIQKMHQEAEKTWGPALVRVKQETKEPFVNVIYDSNPLERLFWDNVVLVGDAAQPTTPQGLRSTNMSLLDVAVLGDCLDKWGLDNLELALHEYQSIRLPVVSKQVLYSRRMGRLKQGLVLEDRLPFDPKAASYEDCEELQQKNTPFFAGSMMLFLHDCLRMKRVIGNESFESCFCGRMCLNDQERTSKNQIYHSNRKQCSHYPEIPFIMKITT